MAASAVDGAKMAEAAAVAAARTIWASSGKSSPNGGRAHGAWEQVGVISEEIMGGGWAKEQGLEEKAQYRDG